MVATELLVLPAAASPQAHLLAYEELTYIRFVPSCTWLEMARRLDDAALRVPAAFKAKYIDRAKNCRATASWMEVTGKGVRPSASEALRIAVAMDAPSMVVS